MVRQFALVAALLGPSACISEPDLFVVRTGDGNGTVTSSPAGIDCGERCAMLVDIPDVTLTAVAGSSSRFVGWKGAGCEEVESESCMPTVTESATIVAEFAWVSHELTVTVAGQGTVTSDPAGISCSDECSRRFGDGLMLTLRATSAQGNMFVGWENAPDCSTDRTCVVVVDSDRRVTARFAPIPPPPPLTYIQVTRYGAGRGRIVSTPYGIDCPGTCGHGFPEGSQVTLSAIPDPTSDFAGWQTPNPVGCTSATQCTFAAQSWNASATFNNQPTLALAIEGAGTVSAPSPAISCSAMNCSYQMPIQTTVSLAAAPATGYRFDHWTGGCSGTAASCEVTMSAPKSVGAVFLPL